MSPEMREQQRLDMRFEILKPKSSKITREAERKQRRATGDKCGKA